MPREILVFFVSSGLLAITRTSLGGLWVTPEKKIPRKHLRERMRIWWVFQQTQNTCPTRWKILTFTPVFYKNNNNGIKPDYLASIKSTVSHGIQILTLLYKYTKKVLRAPSAKKISENTWEHIIKIHFFGKIFLKAKYKKKY